MPGDELDCAIHVDAPSKEALVALLLDAVPDARRERNTIEAPGVELYVEDNDEADTTRRTAFPDGFLHFSHAVELYADAPPAVALTGGLLERLWAAGWPAVASCDYEDQLPRGGGYGSPDLPWPR